MLALVESRIRQTSFVESARKGRSKGSRVYRDKGARAARDEFTSASVVRENHGARQDHLTHGNDSRLGGSCYLA